MIPIGCRIYLKRLERKETQAQLARRAGIPQPNLSNIEKGKQDVTVGTLQKITYALNVKIADFFDERPLIKGAERFRTTKRALNRVVSGILDREVHLKPVEKEIVSLFKAIVVGKHKRKVGSKEMQVAWFKLKGSLTDSAIRKIHDRCKEMGLHEGM